MEASIRDISSRAKEKDGENISIKKVAIMKDSGKMI
jgi:hypothetical protein